MQINSLSLAMPKMAYKNPNIQTHTNLNKAHPTNQTNLQNPNFGMKIQITPDILNPWLKESSNSAQLISHIKSLVNEFSGIYKGIKLIMSHSPDVVFPIKLTYTIDEEDEFTKKNDLKNLLTEDYTIYSKCPNDSLQIWVPDPNWVSDISHLEPWQNFIKQSANKYIFKENDFSKIKSKTDFDKKLNILQEMNVNHNGMDVFEKNTTKCLKEIERTQTNEKAIKENQEFLASITTN